MSQDDVTNLTLFHLLLVLISNIIFVEVMQVESDDETSERSYLESLDDIESVPFRIKIILFYRRLIFFHPLILSPLLTISFLLALFSSLHCNFVEINIGFQPLNIHVESSTLSLCPIVGKFHGGCYLYSEDFTNNYISNDENWTYAKIASFTSIGCSFSSFVSSETYCLLGYYNLFGNYF